MPCLEFTDPFWIYSDVESLYWKFSVLFIVFFSSKISVWYSSNFYLLAAIHAFLLTSMMSSFMVASLNSLSDANHTSVSLGLISGDLACSFRTHFPISSFPLTYCTGIFTMEKTAASFSLHRMASNRRRSLLISAARLRATSQTFRPVWICLWSLCSEHLSILESIRAFR